MRIITAAVAALALSATAWSAAAAPVNVWSTTFDSGSEYETLGPFPWSVLSTVYGGAAFVPGESFPGFGAKYFRNTTAGTTTFTASGLGAHTDLHLSFDLAFVDSWDGFDGGCCSPDYLYLTVDGNPYLTLTSNQVLGSAPIYGPGTLVGIGYYGANPAWPDAVVRYTDLIIPHTGSTFSLAIHAGGAGFQYGDDESWGIDNFKLAASPVGGGVPEPASWGLMISGFALTGAALRRRRVVQVA